MKEQPLFSPKINFPFGRGGSGLYFSGKQDYECVPVTLGIQTPEKKKLRPDRRKCTTHKDVKRSLESSEDNKIDIP